MDINPLIPKCKHFFVLLFFLTAGWAISQTTYTVNPSAGNWQTCPNNNITSNCPSNPTTYFGNTILMGTVSFSGNSGTFIMAKCDGSAFSTSGTMWVKNSGVCGTVISTHTINAGDTFITFPLTFNHTSGNVFRYCVFESSNGVRYYADPAIVTATTASPDLRMNSQISISPTSPSQGGSMSVTAIVKNFGTGSWSGNVVMQLLNSSGSLLTDLDLDTGITIAPNGTRTLNFSTSSVTSSPGNYQIRIQQQDNGSGSYTTVTPNGYTNPKAFTIQAASAPDLKMNSQIVINPSSPMQGGSMSITAQIKNFGNATWSGNVVMQLLNSSGALLTDLDLDTGITIASNGTRTLNFSTSNVSSSPGNYQIRIQQQDNGSGSYTTVTPNGYTNPKTFTIQASSASDLRMNSQISISPTSPSQGSSMTVTAQIKNFGNATWSGNVVMQLLNSSGALLTDLDLDTGITIASNGTRTLNFSTSSVTSSPGTYQIRIQQQDNGSGPWTTVTPNGYTNPKTFTIQASSASDLRMNSQISISPTSPSQGSSMTVTAQIKNFGNATWSGNVVMQLLNSSGALLTDLDLDTGITIASNGTRTLNFSTSSVTSSPGTYQIRIQQQDNGSGPWTTVTPNGYTNPKTFTIQVGGPCSTFTDLPNSGNNTTAYDAAVCLCNQGYITPQNYGGSNTNGVNPDSDIIREDLAKVTYYALYRGNAASPAEDFPVPFNDLDDGVQPYYKYAKALSYLEYGDGISPFDRDFPNFRPGDPIERRYALKVILESFDIPPDNTNGGTIQGVTPSDDAYGYVHRAWDMGLITSASGNSFNNILRRDVFIILHRLISNDGTNFGPSCSDCQQSCWPIPSNSQYFTPGNFILASLGRSIGMSEGYFDSYAKTSFSIPAKNMVLEFTHLYNSYLLEIPSEIRKVCPLGEGWSHSYNSYIIEQAASPGTNVPAKLYVFWPNGSIHTYDRSSLNNETQGSFDIMTESSTIIEIKKKNQVVYRYSKYNGVWYLDKITDRNGNYIDPVLETANGQRRVNRVKDAHGRTLEFYYASGTNNLNRVRDISGNRNIYFTVNGNGDLVTYKNPKGKNTTYQYGTGQLDHYLEHITLPENNTIDITYNANRKLDEVQFPGVNNPYSVNVQPNYGNSTPYTSIVNNPQNGITSTQEYDIDGRMTSKSTGSTNTNVTYNTDKLLSQITTNSLSTTFTYDSNGNVLTVNQPLGITQSYTYNSLNDVTSYTDPKSNTTNYTYVGGNLDKITDNLGYITDYNINSSGLVTSITNPEGITTTFTYDTYGNTKTINLPLGITTTMDYDIISRNIKVTNPLNQITDSTYDMHDLMTSTIRNATSGNITSAYTYDDNDNLKTINSNGQLTSFNYNNRDLLSSTTFGNDTKTYTYRDDNLIEKYTRPDGIQMSYSYDNQGRITGDGYSTYTYDNRNNVKTINKSSLTTSFNYDNLDRLQNYTDVYNKTTAYSYDANSNVTRLTYPGGYKVDYVFDNNNRMTQCKFNNGSKIIVYTYFDDGRLKKMTYPNGTYTDYAYDAAGRMTSLITKKSSGAIICSYNFTLDALGNHVNVTSVEPYTGPPPLSNHTYSGIYNNENEAIQFADSNMSYDANGEQQSKDGRNINWDIGGMITSSGNRNYVYDGMKLMRQADRSGTVRRYAWDLRGMSNIIVEYNGSGTALYYYIHGQGLCARVSVTNNNDIRYYHSDYRGSTIAMTDAAQIVTHKYQFLPFGEIVQCEESDFDNPFKFVGKWGVMHEGGSYYYMRARQYDAENGRFISEDPVWNRNLFGYAEGNPIEMIDPNGEFAISGVILGTLAIVSALQGIDAVVSALTDQYYADSYRKAGNYEMYKKYQNSADQKFLDFHLGNILDWAVGAGLDKFTSIKGVKSAVKRAGTELFGLSEGALPLIDMRFNSSLELVQQFIEYGIGQTLNSGLNRATSNIYSGSVNVSNVYYSNNQCNLIECVGN